MLKKRMLLIISIFVALFCCWMLFWVYNQKANFQLWIETDNMNGNISVYYDYGEGFRSTQFEVLRKDEEKYILDLTTSDLAFIENYRLDFDFYDQEEVMINSISLNSKLTPKLELDLKQLFEDTIDHNIETTLLNMGHIEIKSIGEDSFSVLTALKSQIDNYNSINNYRVMTTIMITSLVLFAMTIIFIVYSRINNKKLKRDYLVAPLLFVGVVILFISY